MTSSKELFSLEGKTALVTGATGYLGNTIVSALAEAGAHVLVNSRSEERCFAMVREYKLQGASVESAVFDITNRKAIQSFSESFGNSPLHILINNAYSGGGGNIQTSSPVSYESSYDVTITATHNLLVATLPSLREAVQDTGYASVINIASMYGIVSPDPRMYDSPEGTNPPFYGVAKAALIQWSRYAACEFGAENIRVNSISPGAFPSKKVQQDMPEFISKLEEKVPMGRIGLSEELKGPILFLSSQASSYVNGANLIVDGGWTSW